MLYFGLVYAAMCTIIHVGLFNSVVFPNIFTLGMGFLIAAIVGGAIVPLAQGAPADRIGIRYAMNIPRR
jgi:FHS family L-fucose permease-like MFS transporter